MDASFLNNPVAIVADASVLENQIKEAKQLFLEHVSELTPEIVNAFLDDLLGLPLEIASVKSYSASTGTGELRISVQMPKRCRELLAALRADNVKRLIV